ncbi:type II toxin-antitoxin system Phd/YefM family antitoxin [Xiamenia xianingshaonis]|uniref:Prevent-host-death protein n=1 Tax=Xiamenia xianingshaonis TaxID=2682776 RepID=A0ABX0IL77_9ACTN|nr:prevent-host-death protein [Xiamenia xianingshaonis]NGM18124.1 prevent-host-death protein [Eggerthellaceae bacterium zg-893]NHM13607.1 prevent-host-death protein [Xiamenia xianingshaonis]
MLQANVLEAKNGLSRLLKLLESGQQDCIVIARRNTPVAKLVPFEQGGGEERIGIAKGRLCYSEGWDSPEANAEVAALFGVGR